MVQLAIHAHHSNYSFVKTFYSMELEQRCPVSLVLKLMPKTSNVLLMRRHRLSLLYLIQIEKCYQQLLEVL